MRGSTRSRGGGREGRGARASPPGPPTASTKNKERHSDWRHVTVPRRSRRSLSPPRPQLSPGCGNATIDRREHALRHQDQEKQQLQRVHRPSSAVPPPRRRGAAFADLVEGYQYPPKYMLPDHPSESKLPRPINDSEIYHHGIVAPHSSSGLDIQGMLSHKSVFSDNVPMRPFLGHPSDGTYPKDSTGMKSTEDHGGSTGTFTRGIQDNEGVRYHNHPSDTHVEGEREKVYTRDRSFAFAPPSHRMSSFPGSSASFVNKDYVNMYHDHLHQPSDEFGRGTSSKLLENPFHQEIFGSADTLRRAPVSPLARDEPWEYAYHEMDQRERDDHGYVVADNMRLKAPLEYSGEYQDPLSSLFMDAAEDRVDEADASWKTVHETGLWDQRRVLPRAVLPECRIHREACEDFLDPSGGKQYDFRMKVSRDHEPELYEQNHVFGRDSGPMDYMGRVKSPMLSDHHVRIYKHDISPPPTDYYRDDLDVYEPSTERMIRNRYYSMEEDIIRGDSTTMVDDQNAFRRIQPPVGDDGLWLNEDRIRTGHSKRSALGRSQHRMTSHQMLAPDDGLFSGNSTKHIDVGRRQTLKRRLRRGPSDFHGSFSSERRHLSLRPLKFLKRSFENRNGGSEVQASDFSSGGNLLKKTEPREGSEEFKQIVHKAFLRYTKMLNESPQHRERFQETGKASNLLCCVCRSQTKYFPDVHGLVSHAYYFPKVGLRTEHLGLHKALCLLMAWNWHMAPDNSRKYQSSTATEAKALKEDLILWPPMIVIHNSSIGAKNKIVTIKRMEEILKEMGFETRKIRVSCVKPPDESNFLVKFMPTLSGLREAERLHNHYAGNKQGRQGFLDVSSKNTDGESRGAGPFDKSEELLHGYMAIAEDLDKLDQDTKKRCLVRSKEEIKAIADAPLNAD
ncbi:putative XS domain-containing protein [Dioscorea sansibarensis]